VLLLPDLLLAVAALPAFSVEDETPRFQPNLNSARDAIRLIERELDRFGLDVTVKPAAWS
jgi:hypothetical protein